MKAKKDFFLDSVFEVQREYIVELIKDPELLNDFSKKNKEMIYNWLKLEKQRTLHLSDWIINIARDTEAGEIDSEMAKGLLEHDEMLEKEMEYLDKFIIIFKKRFKI